MTDPTSPTTRRSQAHEMLSQVEEYLVSEGRDDLVVLLERARLLMEERLVTDIELPPIVRP